MIAVRVKDDEGFTSTARVTVYPGDKPPVVTITKPDGLVPVGGRRRHQARSESGRRRTAHPINTPLPYYWVTRMAHCPDPAHPTACHVHPLQTFAGIRSPEFTAPQHDYPSYIEVVLRVADKRELSGTALLKLNPRTVDLSLASDPPGIPLLAGSTEAAAPFSVPQIDGSEILISAPPTAAIGGRTYTFSGWSDGGVRAHAIQVSSDADPVHRHLLDPRRTAAASAAAAPDPRTARTTLLGKHPPKSTRSTTAKFVFGADAPGPRSPASSTARPKPPAGRRRPTSA